MSRSHKGLSFLVESPLGRELSFPTFEAASRAAIVMSVRAERPVIIAVLVHSVAGARKWGGDYAAEEHRRDPDASVFEQFEVSAKSMGMIP